MEGMIVQGSVLDTELEHIHIQNGRIKPMHPVMWVHKHGEHSTDNYSTADNGLSYSASTTYTNTNATSGEISNKEPGDVVLLKDKDLPRCQWKLGRIVLVPRSYDELVWKEKLRTGGGEIYQCPIYNLILLVAKSG